MKELKVNEDYYLTPDGLLVFTEKYHLNKGYCCGNGCRHCPYDFENVPEPLRSQILNNNNNSEKKPS
ncbi:MAG: tRNA ((46)-N7)-methyltransferase TrmB [Bacteroidota bacterium]|jgi:hypothetical protein